VEFEVKEGKVSYIEEKAAVKPPAIMVKLGGERLTKLQRILMTSGYEQNPQWNEAVKVSHQRDAIIRIAERLLDFAIDEHLPA